MTPSEQIPDRRHWRLMESLQFLVIVGGLVFGAAILNAAVKTQEKLLARIEFIVTDLANRMNANEREDARRDGRLEAMQEMQAEMRELLRRKQ